MPIIPSNNGHLEVGEEQLDTHDIEMIWQPIELPTIDFKQIDEYISKLNARITQLWPNLTPTGPIVEGSIEPE